MIEVQNLMRSYGRDPVIERVTFEVKKGEITGFLGPNGSGKTTTMRILTGYMPMTRGLARVASFDVFTQSLEARRRIGYLPEQPPLYQEMTVASYLDFVAKVKGVPGRERNKSVERAMEQTATTKFRHAIIRKLSKGYKQRVGLAQALVHNPEVLILDEPTVGLDPEQIIEVRELIKNLGGAHTIILSTHILSEVSATCERAVIIGQRPFYTEEEPRRAYLAGTVVAQDTIANLTLHMRGAGQLDLQIEGPGALVQSKLASIAGVKSVSYQSAMNGNVNRFEVESEPGLDLRRELAQAVVQNDWGLLELRAKDSSLEDAFLKLTQESNG